MKVFLDTDRHSDTLAPAKDSGHQETGLDNNAASVSAFPRASRATIKRREQRRRRKAWRLANSSAARVQDRERSADKKAFASLAAYAKRLGLR